MDEITNAVTVTPEVPQNSTMPLDNINQGTVAIEASRAIAEAQGKLVIAKRFPRNEIQAFANMKKACQRTGLANKAFYSYPRGNETVSGPTIRLAEELARCWGNIDFGIKELSQDNGKSEMQAYAWDLETNTMSVQNFTNPHAKEVKGKIKTLTSLRDIYENNAYDIQQELVRKYPNLKLEVLIGSVRNTSRIESVMEHYRPDVVFHAAAHKHVPLMEDSPNEAIKNNVFGTYKTARAADKYGVKKFVLISTDKAVNPTNIMGASKRMCEMIVQTFSKYSRTEYVIVRFGNVLGSNGSVIPLFKKQMEAGGPVTVTHPDIIRYFMTIPEAVSLVLQAGAYAHGGEIFVLDMGEPVKIADLAKNLIRLSGYTLGVNMEIKYTGLRPGEKLYEELLTKEEGLQKTANNLIFIGKPLEFDEVHFLSQLQELEKAAMEESPDIKEKVADMISTYHIRPEDKKRDSEAFQELVSLGRISHEGPIVDEKHSGI